MPKHIARLIVLLVTFGAVAYAAKVYFTVDSYYAYGHYRGNSVAEIASEKPRFKGSEYCRACHAERDAEWAKGVHRNAEAGKIVQCEVCHGPGSAYKTISLMKDKGKAVAAGLKLYKDDAEIEKFEKTGLFN